MDILAQYDKQNPQQQAPQQMYEDVSQTYGPVVRIIIRLSGGKIHREQEANIILIISIMIFTVLSFILLFGLPGSSGPNTPLSCDLHPTICINRK